MAWNTGKPHEGSGGWWNALKEAFNPAGGLDINTLFENDFEFDPWTPCGLSHPAATAAIPRRYSNNHENTPEMRCLRIPHIEITQEAATQMMIYAHSVGIEISGMGHVVMNGNIPRVYKVVLLDQYCTAGNTEIDPASLGMYKALMLQNGEDPAELKCWWHSHGNLDTFWSSTDESAIRDTIPSQFTDWTVSIEVNRRGSMIGRVDLFKPFQIVFDHLPVRLVMEPEYDLIAQLQQEVRKKVRTGMPGLGRIRPKVTKIVQEGSESIPIGTNAMTFEDPVREIPETELRSAHTADGDKS